MYVSGLKPGQQFTLTAVFTATADAKPDGIKLLDDKGLHTISGILENVITIGAGGVLPDMPAAATDEQCYQWDAARSMMTAANDLRRVADRIHHYASLLADGNVHGATTFPSMSLVRGALSEYRSVSNAIMRIDSAMESAMLADRAREAAKADASN